MRRNFAIYITILSVCLLSGIGILLFGHKLPAIKAVNSYFFKKIAYSAHKNSEYQLESYDGTELSRHLHVIPASKHVAPPIGIVDFDLNDTSVFSSIPPLTSDVALVLDELRKENVKHIHFSTQFHRETKEAASSIIKHVLSPTQTPAFENVLIPLQLTRGSLDSPFPSYLLPSSIAQTAIEGNPLLIPLVNKVVFSPVDGVSFTSPEQILSCRCLRFGFSNLESELAQPNKMPLLARWNDRILVSQLLLSTMTLHDVSFHDLKIIIGESIQLGPKKPTIPIDDYGYTALVPENQSSYPSKPFAVQRIFNAEIEHMIAKESGSQATNNQEPAPQFQSHTLLISTPSNHANIQLIKDPYQKLSQLYQYPAQTERAATFFRLPLWLEACILVEFTLICAVFYRLKGLDRHLFYALSLALIWPASALFTSSTGYWIPITPILTVLFTGWTLSCYLSSKWCLRRSSSSMAKQDKKELERFT